MKTSRSCVQGFAVAAFAGAIFIPIVHTAGTPTYRTAWVARYAGSTLEARMQSETGSGCNVCHHPTTRNELGTCYRIDLKARLDAGRTIQQALEDLDGVDSDGDGVPNGIEIMMARTGSPSGVGYHPGLIGALGTDPCGVNPAAAVTSVAETPPAPPTCAADFDGSGTVAVPDIFAFLSAWFASAVNADVDGTPGIGVPDIFAFLSLWFAGC